MRRQVWNWVSWRRARASFNSGDGSARGCAHCAGRPRSAEELVAVLKALGQTGEAAELAKQTLKQSPASYVLREESGQGDDSHLGADVERLLNLAAMYMRLGLYSSALDVLSRSYPVVPRTSANQRSRDRRIIRLSRIIGAIAGSTLDLPRQRLCRGGRHVNEVCVSARATTYKVLQSALRANPQDANAIYLMGTLEFSVA